MIRFTLLSLVLSLPLAAAMEAEPAARAVNQLTVKLYEQLRDQEGSLVLSPYSIASALAMVREGAEGETLAQMDAVLGLEGGTSAEAHAALIRALLPEHDPHLRPADYYSLSVANRVWIQKGFDVHADFTRALEQFFKAELGVADFKRKARRARKEINEWVETMTKGRIEDILTEDPNPLTRLVLVNAIHFKAGWMHAFDPDKNEKAKFHAADGKSRRVEFMRHTDDGMPQFRLAEFEGGMALEMPTKGHAANVVLILPHEEVELAALEQRIGELDSWLGALRGHPVDLWLPRFEAEASFELADVLKRAGMPLAFDPQAADFSGMADEKLHIGAVVHKAWVKADEEGIEAAAATAVLMKALGMENREPKEFRADRPFLFVIRHQHTGAILFMGRIADVAE